MSTMMHEPQVSFNPKFVLLFKRGRRRGAQIRLGVKGWSDADRKHWRQAPAHPPETLQMKSTTLGMQERLLL